MLALAVLLCVSCATTNESINNTTKTATPTMDITATPSEDSTSDEFQRTIQVRADIKPDFILSIWVASYEYPQEMCMEIDESKIWEKGNEATELNEHLKSTVKLAVDNRLLEHGEEFYAFGRLIAIFVYETDDPNPLTDTPTGSYGDVSFCFKTTDLADGIHKAKIELTSLSGVKFVYSWEFEILKAN